MPENAGGLAYGAGFMITTALLHVVGVAIGFGKAGEKYGPAVTRTIGGIAAAAGVGLLAGLI